MPKKVVVRPEVAEEVETAREWYAERSEKAATDFIEEVRTALDAIQQHPKRFPVYHRRQLGRYRSLKRFPYVVIYRELDNAIEILAVAHTSRNPGNWSDRLLH